MGEADNNKMQLLSSLLCLWLCLGVTLAASSGSTGPTGSTCRDIKTAYKASSCCGADLNTKTSYTVAGAEEIVIANPSASLFKANSSANYCASTDVNWANIDCFDSSVHEQAAANVTAGYQGNKSTNAVPITTSYLEAGLCPVNVHWHKGTEHYSLGEYDENGKSPTASAPGVRRAYTGNERQGFLCHLYDSSDSRFTTEYDWKHCTNTHVGETYEVHWPHSKGGACGTPYQYQTPFYDGVFCHASKLAPTTYEAIGVQSQSYVIVNDESYYYPDLINGMIIDGEYGADMAKYTGSTTGDGRNNNDACSQYTPITWQVDRKCHLISASSFDKMCADMKSQADDMSGDLYPHGARTLVADFLAADNHQRRSMLAGIDGRVH